MGPKISVVVVARNEEKHIGECLRRLKNQKVKPYEIIVIDGYSTDKTAKIARKYAKVFFEDKKRRGVGNARNTGWKKAKGDYIAYCDADARPPLDWVEKIIKLINGYVAISGTIIPYGNKRVKRKVVLWTGTLFPFFSKFGKHFFNGSNMVIKRSALKKCPFRLNLMEDFDIGRRLKKIGKVRYFRELEMYISPRRYEKSLYRMALKNYIPNMFRIIFKRKSKDYSYFN